MDIISDLEKKLILFFKSNFFEGLIKGIYTCIPDDANYPFIKIEFFKKSSYMNQLKI
ncbi:hypothetical protein [Rickettsiales endosymbiont of Trichoplax sp. H2]|uniref:hypothetical protein n=1 Tax=Rickettsiales endosymbiont of Trichoplax sp. H2 TaxID=2021221 RepID=UPI0012B3FDDD|nr:hypothetical protein [Rickettsiales endosymbiont of Trichoplax sp. H2]MSO13211.1 hypothetical protein [Rickettsiales endosymbiont of Trichoplax sp. H2]